jgi:hypothetical protein
MQAAVGESYTGGVVIRQKQHTASIDACIAVEDEAHGAGWTILFDAHAATGFDPSELFEVELPNGGHGRFVHCPEPAISEALGVGLGWPPTARRG